MARSKAIVQAIRVVAVTCTHHNLQWYVTGRYIRSLLSPNPLPPPETPVDVCLMFDTPSADKLEIAVQAYLDELQLLGFIQRPTAKTSAPQAYAVTMQVHGTEIPFKFTLGLPQLITQHTSIHAAVSSAQPFVTFSTDTIALGPTGLKIIQKHPKVDALSPFGGIALLERMLDLKQSTTRMVVQPVANNNYIPSIRQYNAKVLRSQAALLEKENIRCREGTGYILTPPHEDATCPICLGADSNRVCVQLRCGHMYCATCLADHMQHMQDGSAPQQDYHGTCPMCRSPIQFVTATNAEEPTPH